MSLISINEAPRASGHINDEFVRDASKVYLALFNTSDDEMYVAANCSFSIYSSIHPSDPEQRLLDINSELLKANVTNPETNGLANLWEITLTYGAWDFYNKAPDGNPLNVPVRLRIDITLAEVAAFEDVDGNPIVNAAGDPYDPPLTREVIRATLTVLRNESHSFNILGTLQLSNTLNVATWNSFPAKTVRLGPLKLPEPIYSQVINNFYFPMEYVFDINWDTWVKQIVNAGFRQLDASGNLVPILINGQPATTPVPLDESGHAILTPTFKESTGDTPDDSSSGGYSGEGSGGSEVPIGGTGVSSSSNLVIDAYDLVRTADFSALGMDSLFTLPTIP